MDAHEIAARLLRGPVTAVRLAKAVRLLKAESDLARLVDAVPEEHRAAVIEAYYQGRP